MKIRNYATIILFFFIIETLSFEFMHPQKFSFIGTLGLCVGLVGSTVTYFCMVQDMVGDNK